MPELPEVETVVRGLRPVLCGAQLSRSTYFDAKLRQRSLEQLRGKVLEVRRVGKNIVIDFDNGQSLIFHLRMTGNLLWQKGGKGSTHSSVLGGAVLHSSSMKHLRCALFFDRGELQFVDTRRFGTVSLLSCGKTFTSGFEPLSDELDDKVLADLLRTARQEIKVWLLRQDKLTGIGNIYASEILFTARISPFSPAGELDTKQIKRLTTSIKKVLNRAVQHCGTTFSDFRDTAGAKGGFQNFLKVYDRADLPCRACKSPIIRTVQGGRSTYYCRKCQGTD